MFKKYTIVWLALILCNIPLHAYQEVSEQKALADNLSNRGRDFIQKKAYDSAITLLRQSLQLNESLNRRLQVGNAFNDIGVAYHNLKKYDSAIIYYDRAKSRFLAEGDSTVLPITLANLGMLYKRGGNYKRALENLFTVLDYDIGGRTRASTLNTIGSTYSQSGQYNFALEYYLKSIHFYKQLDNQEKRLGIVFNNIGNTFNKLRLFDSAANYFNKSIVLKTEIGDRGGVSKTLNNLGLMYLEMQDLDRSKEILSKSLKIKNELEDSLGIANTLNLIARIDLRNENLTAAKRKLDLAHRITKKFNAPYVLRENLKRQSEYFEKTNDWKNHSVVLSQYIALNDSLLDVEKVRSLAEMQVKYESEKKDDEISYLQEIEALQEADISHEKSLKNIYLGFAGLLSLSLVVVFILFFKNRKKSNKIEYLNQEMQHRIKNHLQVLSGMLKLQGYDEKDETEVSSIRENESRVNAMALVHQLLYANKDEREIEISNYVAELCQFLKRSFSSKESILLIKPHVSSLKLDVDKATSVGLIINELITNSIKHAFKNQAEREISIRFQRLDSGSYFLEVRDNGEGLDLENNDVQVSSFGFKLIRMLSKQLNAELNVFNESGAVFQFSIPSK